MEIPRIQVPHFTPISHSLGSKMFNYFMKEIDKQRTVLPIQKKGSETVLSGLERANSRGNLEAASVV